MYPLEKLIRKNIACMVPYSSARKEYTGKNAVFLDANENPYNIPYNRYPDPLQSDLKKKIAGIKGMRFEKIFIGNGSDEAIDLLFRVFCVPGTDNVIIPEPSYGMYEVLAEINDIHVKKVLLKNDFNLDADKIISSIDERTKLVFICSPNNPTGNSFEEETILKILLDFQGVLILDEAYIDFAPHNGFLRYLKSYPNLVILQTFSKAWGMAGIRLGVAYADETIVNVLNKIKYPYNVSYLTQQTALDMMDRQVEKGMWIRSIIKQREILRKSLEQFTFVRKVFPSDANFLLVRVDDPGLLHTFLESEKCIVRNRSKIPLCDGCLRITVGTEIENNYLINKLMQFQNETKT